MLPQESYHIIYGLVDPRTKEIRYIGLHIGSDPAKRIREHMCLARKGKKQYVYDWLRQLIHLGLYPDVTVLEEVDVGKMDELRKSEQYHIRRGRELGWRLTNLTDGGEGCFGYKHSPEMKNEISVRQRGKKLTEEDKIRRRWLSPEQESLVEELYKTGKTLAEVGVEIGLSSGGVLKILKRRNVPRRQAWAPSEKKRSLTDEQALLVASRYRGGERTAALAKEFGCSTTTIKQVLYKLGVPRRKSGSVNGLGQSKSSD